MGTDEVLSGRLVDVRSCGARGDGIHDDADDLGAAFVADPF
ncbi:MAG: hypothetical protein ACOYEP_04485 [Limnochordia bacterium]|jgi:hypothetical protein